MARVSMIEVQVVCALREQQVLRSLRVESTCSIADVVARSAVLDEFPDLDPCTLSFAVFGIRASGSQRVHDGDRVEVLRALQVDPREARRRRAALRARQAPLAVDKAD